MDDNNPTIGRDIELAKLEEALAEMRSGLVLVVGRPSTGKGRLIRELRARATMYPCVLVPAYSSTDKSSLWLVINKQSTVEDFSEATVPPSETRAESEPSTGHDFALVLVYGYRPDEKFHRWFTGEFLRSLATSSPPRMVVVAGTPEDVAELKPLADRQIVLEPLSRNAVVTELRKISAAIADRLQERELELYADAVVADPSLLGALRHLLPLTATDQPPAHLVREE